ncbi:MAG: phospholipid/cholesterol/gamma-HCH transport system substrate-binding protein [Chloroflexota bacterium]|jgi:phospholipid/cholesterol/gamma-HCH transport system substrate-binding protein|nr:phospholipid/cholesterol/gamma-HCH transport system substrate-binding protein [Chloroflexota bacterium]
MRSRFAISRLLLFIGLLSTVLGAVAFGPNLNYTLRLDFTNADGLVQNEDVTVAGVKVGSVKSLEVSGKVAVVTVEVTDKAYVPLRSGTKALVRQLSLLGNKYVELFPGSTSGGVLASGSEIGIDNTTSPTDLDQINAIFDAPTREKLKAATLQGEIALGGRAETLNKDLLQLRNLAVAAEPVTGVLDSHQASLDRATIAFDTLTQKLVREDLALRGLVSHGSSVLTALQEHDAQLAGVLQHGDASFTRLDAVLNGNENALASFFARQPSSLQSTDFSVKSSIPVTQAALPLMDPLFELLYNQWDASIGRDGPDDPNNPNSGTQYTLRALSVICPTISTESNGTC